MSHLNVMMRWLVPGGLFVVGALLLGELLRAAPTRNEVSIIERDGMRYITSNGIPEHTTGRFPNRGNPNTIGPQHYKFRVPIEPTPVRHPRFGGGWFFGVGLNGVPFEPGTAEAWKNNRNSGWNIEAFAPRVNLGLDKHNAHVQPTGAYHYHGIPTGLVKGQGGQPDKMTLIGYAADGYPMYSEYAYEVADDSASKVRAMKPSWRLKSGERPAPPTGPGGAYDGTYVQDFEFVAGLGDLDAFNGRTGVTPEYPSGTYYYMVTESFPYIPRSWRGVPDQSFAKHGFRRGGPPPGAGRHGPP